MTKKCIIIGLFIVGIAFIQASTTQAGDYNSSISNSSSIQLPNAGLTPNSPFYFLERAAEAIGEFLTFNIEAKAKLQAKRALERIAEVKEMLAEKKVNPKGLDVALDRLQANVVKAAKIVQKEQQKGKDVSKLAKELDTDFEIRKRLLKQIMEDKDDQIELVFKQQKLELKKQFIEAKLANDAQKVGEIVLALDKLEQEKEAQEFLLDQEEEEFELALEIEEEKFELALEVQERELELKEEEAEFAFEQKKRELERQFEEAKQSLELKEEALENQLDIAVALGDSQKIEDIKEQLGVTYIEIDGIDDESTDTRKALEEVERNFELLMLKEERALEDFVRQEELALKKAEFEMEKVLKENEIAKRALELEEKKLERALELREKELELREEERERTLESKEEKFERLQEEKEEQLERTREGAERLEEQKEVLEEEKEEVE